MGSRREVKVHCVQSVKASRERLITGCGVECWMEDNSSDEASTVQGFRIEVTDVPRNVTCKRCIKGFTDAGREMASMPEQSTEHPATLPSQDKPADER